MKTSIAGVVAIAASAASSAVPRSYATSSSPSSTATTSTIASHEWQSALPLDWPKHIPAWLSSILLGQTPSPTPSNSATPSSAVWVKFTTGTTTAHKTYSTFSKSVGSSSTDATEVSSKKNVWGPFSDWKPSTTSTHSASSRESRTRASTEHLSYTHSISTRPSYTRSSSSHSSYTPSSYTHSSYTRPSYTSQSPSSTHSSYSHSSYSHPSYTLSSDHSTSTYPSYTLSTHSSSSRPSYTRSFTYWYPEQSTSVRHSSAHSSHKFQSTISTSASTADAYPTDPALAAAIQRISNENSVLKSAISDLNRVVADLLGRVRGGETGAAAEGADHEDVNSVDDDDQSVHGTEFSPEAVAKVNDESDAQKSSENHVAADGNYGIGFPGHDKSGEEDDDAKDDSEDFVNYYPEHYVAEENDESHLKGDNLEDNKPEETSNWYSENQNDSKSEKGNSYNADDNYSEESKSEGGNHQEVDSAEGNNAEQSQGNKSGNSSPQEDDAQESKGSKSEDVSEGSKSEDNSSQQNNVEDDSSSSKSFPPEETVVLPNPDDAYKTAPYVEDSGLVVLPNPTDYPTGNWIDTW